MKKTTLLIIGAFAFVLQSATAQPYTVYYNDFEGQTIGDTPRNQDGGLISAGTGNSVSQTWDVENVNSGEVSTKAAVLSWAMSDTTSWGTGFWSGDNNSWIPSDQNALSDMTFSIELAVTGAAGNQAISIWFDQYPGNIKTFDGVFTPTLATDGSWNEVSFTLDQLQNNGGAYNGQVPFSITFDSGGAGMLYRIGTDTVWIDDLQLIAANPIPEPGTIALLTLGGLGALVAIRRRRA
jgi:hypothetical protein